MVGSPARAPKAKKAAGLIAKLVSRAAAKKGEKRGKPRCRPTKAQCKGYKRPDERNENMKLSKELLEGIIFEETRRFMFETNVLPSS